MFNSISGTDSSVSSSTPPKPKRAQVARACDFCRAHRVKCDSSQPCQNCLIRGVQCTNKGSDEVRTLPSAIREMDRLRNRIHELERELEDQKRPSTSPIPNRSNTPRVLPLDPMKEHGSQKKHWCGIQTSATLSDQTQNYGPSSSFYFIDRILRHLESTLNEPHSHRNLQLKSASRTFASPTNLVSGDLEENLAWDQLPTSGSGLNRMQEQYFIGLFWQSYYCIYPIFHESEFREHYSSLWSSDSTSRKQSALVDIVLAVCMQYGTGFLPRVHGHMNGTREIDSNDATIAGRWYYRRCQRLLTAELESPSMSTLQCQLLIVIYLYNASFHNLAFSYLGLAVRTAQTIGIQHEPQIDIPRFQKELRKRLWWTLYALESKICMTLGRPWAAHLSESTCTLPTDDHELASALGSHFGTVNDDVTWITFNVQFTKLILAARAIYVAFYENCTAVADSSDSCTESQYLEKHAEYLVSSMNCMQTWVESIPDAMKTKRKGDGKPFSTDRSAVQVEDLAPLWLQRQRLVLELLYHNLSMNLYRPFISFSQYSDSCSPLAEGNANYCLNHAITITKIMYQILNETDILNGWYEAFEWQWNAALSLVGYILAYPVSPSRPSARKALDCAAEVFDEIGENLTVATSAAHITRDLTAKADLILDRFRMGLSDPSPSFLHNTSPAILSSVEPSVNQNLIDFSSFQQLSGDFSSLSHGELAMAVDLAYPINSYGGGAPAPGV